MRQGDIRAVLRRWDPGWSRDNHGSCLTRLGQGCDRPENPHLDTDPRARCSNPAATEEPRALHLNEAARTSVTTASPDCIGPILVSQRRDLPKPRAQRTHLSPMVMAAHYLPALPTRPRG